MSIDERIINAALYVIETGATVRDTAARFGIGKSTAHTDLTVRLKQLDTQLYKKVRQVLQKNKEERHLRGGDATRKKYKKTLA